MNDPILAALVVLLLLIAACAAYRLVKGLRTGRIGRRMSLAIYKMPITPEYNPRYSYRDRDPIDFWLEAAALLLAALMCILMIVVLTSPKSAGLT